MGQPKDLSFIRVRWEPQEALERGGPAPNHILGEGTVGQGQGETRTVLTAHQLCAQPRTQGDEAPPWTLCRSAPPPHTHMLPRTLRPY